MSAYRRRAVIALAGLALGVPAVGAHAAAPASVAVVSPTVLVVAPGGSDLAAGTVAAPLATIQVAVDRLTHGGRVELRGGTYHQRVRLVGVHSVMLEPYHHEHAVLSGAGLTPPAGISALVEVANSTAVTVSGLDLTAHRTTKLDVTPAGIYVHGHDHGVRITGNRVHDLGNTNDTLGSFDINAHGIAVYGDDPHASVSDLTIAGNRVDHLRLGASESVVVNGNVDHWVISRNRIRDNDNIGIDAIGYEETLTGSVRYTNTNRARNGVIADNVVQRIRSKGNPAYWEGGSGANTQWCNCADGIYVDGGSHIHITGNRVASNDIGIEVAAENPRGEADHVRTDHNRITGSLYVGIATGGYCNGADDCGGVRTGRSVHNVFEHNVLRDNNGLDDGSPELLVQYYTSYLVFRYNTITATNHGHVVYGTVPGGTSHGNLSDHNVFRATGSYLLPVSFAWSGRTYTSFWAYRGATGQDRHSSLRHVR